MKNKEVFKKMMSYFIPIFLELFLLSLLSTIDTMMLSNYNKLMVNAVGTASTTLSLLNVLLVISANGVAIVVGQYIGAKKNNDAKNVLAQGICFNFILGLLLFLVFYLFAGPLLKIVNTKESFFEFAKTYIKIYAFALPCEAITQVINANFRAYGKPFYMTVVSVVSNLVNVLFNYLLIFGIGIFPELGIKGAAIATVISIIFKMICAIVLNAIIIKCPLIPRKIDFKTLGAILKIGGPGALESTIYQACMFVLLSALNTLTDIEIGSRVYINMMLSYIFLFSQALGGANSIFVARYVGAHEYDKAKKITTKSTLYGLIIVVIFITILNVFGTSIFMLIINDMEYVKIIVKILPLAYLLDMGRCIDLVVIGAQKASGDVLFPCVLAAISMSLFMGLGSWVLGVWLKLGLFGIFLAQTTDETCRCIVSLIRWYSNKWMNKSLIKEEVNGI